MVADEMVEALQSLVVEVGKVGMERDELALVVVLGSEEVMEVS